MESKVMEYKMKSNVLSGILQQFDNYLNEARVLGKEILDGNVCMHQPLDNKTQQFLRFTKKLRINIQTYFRNADVCEYFKESNELKVIRQHSQRH